MKLVGIITIQKCNNYGADLQAFALQRALQRLGHDAENIDYLFYKNPGFKKSRKARPIFKLSMTNRLKEWLLPKINAVKAWKSRRVLSCRNRAFESFFAQNVKLSRQYCSIDALYADPPKYDVYVTGSDQVWNPRTGASVEPYFLTFAPNGARKVSYASSFGVASLPPVAYKTYSEWLEDYSAISLREASGVRIVRQFVGCVRPEIVCDPTLLLSADTWREVARVPDGVQRNSFLLVYDLNVCPRLWTLARRLAQQLNVPVVRICRSAGCEKIKGVLNIADAGPAEFVGLVDAASAVVTTSFHGTVFSVIFGKPFYSVIPKGMTNAGRIENLLGQLRLKDRMVKEDVCDTVALSVQTTDYAGNLDDMRIRSLNFLKAALE